MASFRFGTNGTIPDAGDVAVRKKRDLLARRLASMLLGHDVDDGAFGEEGDELGGLGRRALLNKKGGGSANGDGKLSGRQRPLGSDHNIDVHEVTAEGMTTTRIGTGSRMRTRLATVPMTSRAARSTLWAAT